MVGGSARLRAYVGRLVVTLVTVVLLTLRRGGRVHRFAGEQPDAVGSRQSRLGPQDAVLALIVVLILAILYYAGPNVRQPGFRWVTPGGIVAVVLWVVASAAFAFYIANFP